MYNANNQTNAGHHNNKLVLLLAAIAVIAIGFAAYAFMQKKEADKLAVLAQQKAVEVMQQQAMALQQRKIADSSKEQAVMQREFAVESEVNALKQQNIAATASENVKKKEEEVLQKNIIVQEKTAYAQQQKEIAEQNAERARIQQEVADKQKAIAAREKTTALRLEALAASRRLANEAIALANARLYDSSTDKALRAFELNNANDGADQVAEIYEALQLNWVKRIDNGNEFTGHNYPVRSVVALPKTNIFFSVDESGVVYKCIVKEGGVKKLASYNVKDDARCMAVSPNGSKLVVITASGNASVLNCVTSGITFLTGFHYEGVGKSVAFDGDEHIIVLSSKALYNFSLDNTDDVAAYTAEPVTAFAVQNKRFIIASNKTIKVFNNWQDVKDQSADKSFRLESKIASVSFDRSARYVAAGTYTGLVWLMDLEANETWDRSLHLSAVNDLQFAIVAGNKLQLATASSDQTQKLIDVKAMLSGNRAEDVITLKAHTKWVYAVSYTNDGKWLLSASEDCKVIAWKPTAKDLYYTLSKN